MRRCYDDLRAREAEVLAICFDPLERAERYAREQALVFPLLADPERRVYRAYGLERGTLGGAVSPGAVLGYARFLLAGRRPHRPRADPLQLGGDFVVDPTGRLALVHPSQGPTDRPTVGALLAAIGSAEY